MEVERQVRALEVDAVIAHELLDRQIDLADQHAVVELIDHGAELGHDIMDARLVGGKVGQEAADVRRALGPGRVRRIVAKLLVLDEVPDHVDPEPVDPACHPEPQHVGHRAPYGRVSPIEVGLLGQEGVVVVLAARRIERPGRAAEIAHPVVGRAAVRRGIAPDVPVALRRRAARPAFDEPWVLVGGVVRHEIEDELQPAGMNVGDQPVEILERPEDRVDTAIVRDVITEVRHRRWEDRRQPDRVDAERNEMIEPPAHAFEIADPVSVRVLERARIDLVDDAALPPAMIAQASLRFRMSSSPPRRNQR